MEKDKKWAVEWKPARWRETKEIEAGNPRVLLGSGK